MENCTQATPARVQGASPDVEIANAALRRPDEQMPSITAEPMISVAREAGDIAVADVAADLAAAERTFIEDENDICPPPIMQAMSENRRRLAATPANSFAGLALKLAQIEADVIDGRADHAAALVRGAFADAMRLASAA